MKGWAAAVGLLVIAAAALGLRVGELADRPLHNDEAINAFRFERLREGGGFRYDPHEYHGPTLYYLSLPIAAVTSFVAPDQAEEVGLRAVSVVFGVGLILLLILLADGLGWPMALVAGLGIAVSPAMVYYSRYYIHEPVLVFFTGLALAAVWRYVRRPGAGWAMIAGASVGMMYATKETFVFAVAAAGLAGLGLLWIEGRGGTPKGAPLPGGRAGRGTALESLAEAGRRVSRRDLWLAAGAAVGVTVLFYTSFLTHLRGPWDAVRTYFIWAERAGGASPHLHPWYFYFERLGWFQRRGGPLWTEAAVLGLALAGGWRVARGRGMTASARVMGRFVALYTAGLAAVYSVIPYKTPWCFLGFHHGFLILAAYGVWGGWEGIRNRAGRGAALAFGVAGLVAAGHLGWQAWRSSREFGADFRNPYVYGHTSGDIRNLLEQVTAVTRVHPDGYGMPIQVMAPGNEYWPLPWYWRNYARVGWWDRLAPEPYAPVMVVASKLEAGFEERTRQGWLMVGMFELRPRFFVELYVEAGLWRSFLAARAAERARGTG